MASVLCPTIAIAADLGTPALQVTDRCSAEIRNRRPVRSVALRAVRSAYSTWCFRLVKKIGWLWRNRCSWGVKDHMASTAELIFHSRFVYADGAIREMVSWKLPQPSPERPRGFKYRLHYGSVYGHSVVRYDNEAGKGDHCHLGGRENPYQF